MNLKENKKAVFYTALLASPALGAVIIIAAGFKKVSALSSAVLTWCRSVVVDLCLPYAPFFKTVIFFSATAIILIGVLYALIKGGCGLISSWRAVKKLPLSKTRGRVALIKDDTVSTAFTHGLLRPKIYISTGLLKGLSREEVKSVMLHEIHHSREKDPLKFFAFTLVKDAFFYLPLSAWLLKELLKLKEKSADDNVVEKTKDPLSLASALVRVARAGSRENALSSAYINGAGTIEERVKRLIEGEKASQTPVPKRTLIRSAAFGLVVMFALGLPLISASPADSSCTSKHCSMHAEKIGEHCVKHCEKETH